jgi:predicted transcriptional regulator
MKGLVVLRSKYFSTKVECCGTFENGEIPSPIIKVLERGDLISQKEILQEADLKLDSPKEILDFLINSQLITERKVGNKKVYALTDKGQRLFNYFRSNDNSEIFGGTNINRID